MALQWPLAAPVPVHTMPLPPPPLRYRSPRLRRIPSVTHPELKRRTAPPPTASPRPPPLPPPASTPATAAATGAAKGAATALTCCSLQPHPNNAHLARSPPRPSPPSAPLCRREEDARGTSFFRRQQLGRATRGREKEVTAWRISCLGVSSWAAPPVDEKELVWRADSSSCEEDAVHTLSCEQELVWRANAMPERLLITGGGVRLSSW